MKNLFTILCISLFLLMSFSANAAGLSDIEGHDSELAIQYLYDNDMISGYPDGSFKPDNSVNRAELLRILIRGNNVDPEVVNHNNCFSDVTDEWFAPYICYAKERGWIDGYDDGTFRPGEAVNKVEAIKMLVNTQEYMLALDAPAESVFTDVDTDEWYEIYMRAAFTRGILGKDGGIYGVGDDMTRGEISENIYRTILYEKNELNREYGLVVNVVDGDTIDVDLYGEEVRVRLIGIDTPETVAPGGEVECFGPEASQATEDGLLGKYVNLTTDKSQGDKDKYGRYLRYVVVMDGAGIMFNQWLLEEGYAYEYTYDEDYWRRDDFVEAQEYAEENGNGLWAEGVCEEDEVDSETTDYYELLSDISISYNCSSNAYNCSSFSTHLDAQAAFDYCFAETGSDIHNLDGDGDGAVCEDLP